MKAFWYRIPLWVRAVGVLAVGFVLWPLALLVAPFVLVGWWSRQTGRSAWNALVVLISFAGFVYVVMALWYLGKHGIISEKKPQRAFPEGIPGSE